MPCYDFVHIVQRSVAKNPPQLLTTFLTALFTTFLPLFILKHTLKHMRQKEKQTKHPIYTKAKRLCHPQKQPAQNPVSPLAKSE